jgi:hypothetical protein
MDPLGFIDGSSLYRAYFVPGGVDPEGLKACVSKCDVNSFLIVRNELVSVHIHNRVNYYWIWHNITFALELNAPSTKADCVIKNYRFGTISTKGKVQHTDPKWTNDGPGDDPTWWDGAAWRAAVLYVPIKPTPARPPVFTQVKPKWFTPQDATFYDSPGRTTRPLRLADLPVAYTYTFKTEVEDKATGAVVASINNWTAQWTAKKSSGGGASY